MAKDLTIRLLGRPQVSQDSQVGYQTVRRKYVVEGPRASLQGIEDSSNPLFLAVGTPDEEFTDHYLVNQQLSPSEGSMDKAFLTREFVEIRNTWMSESVTESPDLKKLTRKYTVLRSQHNLGYDSDSWANHPRDPKNNQGDPFEYLPKVVKETSPNNEDVFLPELPWGEESDEAYLTEDEKLYTGLRRMKEDMGVGNWIPSGAQVSMVAPGVDVWTVAWATHGKPYWTTGSTRGGAVAGPAAVIDFNEHGIRINKIGVSGGRVMQAYTLVFYAVAQNLPTELVKAFGGTLGIKPSVSFDFHFKDWGGNKILSEKRLIENAVFQHSTGGIKFPNNNGGFVQVATGEGGAMQLIFKGDFLNPPPGCDAVAEIDLPVYQGSKIYSAGGSISYTHLYDTSRDTASMVGTKIKPVLSHKEKKIWRVEVTYIN